MPGVCLNSWQTYERDWSIGYLWRWTNWLGRLDVVVLALMLAYIVIIVSRGSYRYHLARRKNRAFVRGATSAFQSGAFEEVITVAARNDRSPVAVMVATGLTTFVSAPPQSTLAEATDTASRAFQRSQRKFAADLSLGVGTLKSIASTGPFLGLAGTCFGIMSAFGGIGMQKDAALAIIASRIAAALVTTATGLLVAVPAVWSYNYLRACIEVLESEMSNMAREAITHLKSHPQWRSRRKHFDAGSKKIVSGADADACLWEIRYDGQRSRRYFQFAQGLPLTKQFSELPAFALMAAPWLAVILAVFIMIFSSSHTSVGLDVRLVKPGGLATRDHLSVKPIVIGIVDTSTNGSPAVYVNSKKTPWDELDNTVRSELKVRPKWIAYVEAQNNVRWADVANAIDVVAGLHADVVLLTITPDINSSHTHRPAKSMK